MSRPTPSSRRGRRGGGARAGAPGCGGGGGAGRYIPARDVATYAIVKEVEAGRGSPHGGAYLSFEHCSEATLRQAFGPVIDRLAKNNIAPTPTPTAAAPRA